MQEPKTASEYLDRAVERETQAEEIAFRDPHGARALRRLAAIDFDCALECERGNEHIFAA